MGDIDLDETKSDATNQHEKANVKDEDRLKTSRQT